jgi:hypothetical protein
MQRVWSSYLGFIPTIHTSSSANSSNLVRKKGLLLRKYQTDPHVLGALISNSCRYRKWTTRKDTRIFSFTTTNSAYSHSRRSAESSHSNTGSTHPMLPTMNAPLDPPSAPFANSSNGRQSPSSSHSASSFKKGLSGDSETSSVSLSVNYLPKKFSNTLLTAGPKRRKAGKGGEHAIPKMGGGVEAFRSGESRMPGKNDEDYDSVSLNTTPRKLRWNKFKWILFTANCFVRFTLSIAFSRI